ncbi:MAG: NAD(P)/FAD-dependent oxidoreductase [Solirubrobacteraceae bacterium]
MRVGELGWWWRSLGGPPAPRAPLAGPVETDVAIAGAGFTGLWTAYYLKRADPSLRIVVLEAQIAGFGASGRNGGWVSGFFSGPPRLYERARPGGHAALQREMFATVVEIERVLAEERIAADFVRAGHLGVAIGAAQLTRMRRTLAAAREQGLAEADLRELSEPQLRERVQVRGALGGSFSPHVARVHPAKLLAGLAAAVERLGVVIHESTPVIEIGPHRAVTARGTVSARWVVRATEGYTRSLRGERRTLAPVNSSMIITEPLPDAVWEQIGWRGCELIGDEAHVYVYLQRTADGRIAIGGRGVPYRYGSRTGGRGETAARTVAGLRAKLTAMFPASAGVALEHAWSGVLGVTRDWGIVVQADQRNGLASAGGYAGEGVAASNLAARILRDSILARETALTALPWVGRTTRRWEPEPLRWCGIRGVYALYRRADRIEAHSGLPSRLGRLADALSGRV